MDWFVRGFIRASLIWLGIGALLGLYMVFSPAAVVYRPAHAHLLVVGFVAMMIFGVAYHVIPRFTGRPIHSRVLAIAHFWSANVGLALMVAGWLARGAGTAVGNTLLAVGGVLLAAALALFIINLWITLGPQRPPLVRPGGPTRRPED